MSKPRIKNNVFIDSNGTEWSAELLQELIDGIGHFNMSETALDVRY